MTRPPDLPLSAVRSTYDAIVIGSGAGGATLTWKLAKAGLKVLLVEAGGWHDLGSPAPGAPADRLDAIGLDGAISFVGGQTKFYGAALYRLRESDFQAVQHEAGVSPAWPISYDDLEPYYAEGEALYRVHGAAEGDPSEPPRSGPYPHPPLPHDPLVGRVIERLAATGTPVAAIPKGLDYGPGRPCTLCSNCDAFVCRVNAKMDAELAAVRPALATGNVDLLTHTNALKVETDASGKRATGIVLEQGGVEKRVSAPVVCVCAGLERTLLLLRRSRTDQHREGLGNHSGRLGRFVAGHTTRVCVPLVSFAPLGARHTKTFAINAFYEGDADWPYPMGVIQVAGQYPLGETGFFLKRAAVEFVAQRSLICFYMTEALPTAESGFVFEGDEIGAQIPPLHNWKTFARLRRLTSQVFGRAGYPVLHPKRDPLLWHPTGGAVMGDDPAHSVTDSNCQVHGVEGLYVVNASVLPSAGAVNTGLTIIALALRAGDAIAR